MLTEMFFDDFRLLGRDGTRRAYGKPVLIGEYTDPNYSADYFSPWVLTRGREFVMLYIGARRDTGETALLAARSADGVHFELLYTGKENAKQFSGVCNLVMPLGDGAEPISVLEDRFAPPEERYKMILTRLNREQMHVSGTVYASSDLVVWREFLHEIPGWSCEPVGGTFYNPTSGCYTILHRTTWGTRCTGTQDTKDFRTYGPYALCLHQDALDGAMDELYGMSAFEYKGQVIGFPLLYTDNAPSRKTKFEGGNIVPQLAYSWDGHHFLRSLREPFLPETSGQPSLNWLSCARQDPDGGLTLYSAYTPHPHGEAFRSHRDGRIRIYRLREDGFICLKAGAEEATVTTREYLYHGGEIGINLRAERAAAAIIDTSGEEPTRRVWGSDEEAAGFGYADCEPFSGDSTCWHPRFAGGSMDRLKGRVLILEIKYTNGELYSVSGDFTPLSNTQAARYRKLGK